MSVLDEISKNPEIVKKLSRPIDEVIYTIGLLKKLGRANISSLDNRIICQKIIYFAMHLGLIPVYKFNLYLKGPYSPDLAGDLRALSNKFTEIMEVDFLEKTNKNKFESLEKLCGELSYDSRKLEITATLYAYLRSYSKEEAIKKLKGIKHATDDEVKNALSTLRHTQLTP